MPLRHALALTTRAIQLQMLTLFLLRLGEHILLASAALSLAAMRGGFAAAALVSCILTGVLVLRGLVRSALLASVRIVITQRVTQAVLYCQALLLGTLRTDRAETIVFEGRQAAEQLLAESLPALAADGVAALLLLAWLAPRQPARVLVLEAVTLSVAMVVAAALKRLTIRATEQGWQAFLPVIDSLHGAIGGGLEIVASGHEQTYLTQSQRQIKAWAFSLRHADRMASIANRAPLFAGAAAAALIVVSTSHPPTTLLWASSATRENAAFVASTLPPLAGLLRHILEITRLSAQFAPLADWFALPPSALLPMSSCTPPGLPPLPAPIHWRHVCFSYQAEGPAVLSNVNVVWNPGQILVFTGPNGSGKSTLMRLLLGIQVPTSGFLNVGGVPLDTLDPSAWRRSLAYLPQRPFLPERMTVREALRFTACDATDMAAQRVLTELDLWPTLLSQSPAGPLEVVLRTLSVGQRQRIALARVFLQDARILLLDEPDANLDATGTQLLARALRQRASEQMIVLIAHSEELTALADQGIPLEAGRSDHQSLAAEPFLNECST